MQLLFSLVLTRVELQTLQRKGTAQVCRPVWPQPHPITGRTKEGDSVLWVYGPDGRVAGWWKSVYDRKQAGDPWGRPFVVQTVGLIGWELPVQEDFTLSTPNTGCYEADGATFVVPQDGLLASWRDYVSAERGGGSQPAYLLPLALCRYTVRLTNIQIAPVDAGTDTDFILRGVGATTVPDNGTTPPLPRDVYAALWNARYAAIGLAWQTHPWAIVQTVEMVGGLPHTG